MRGGLVDLEFIAQHLQLVHAAAHPDILEPEHGGSPAESAGGAACCRRQAADALLPAARLFNNLTQVLRLCLDGPFEPAKAPDGLKTLLARAGEAPDFARLEADLAAQEAEVAALFGELGGLNGDGSRIPQRS